MSILTARLQAAYTSYYKIENFFSLGVSDHKDMAAITMRVHLPIVNTRHLPQTLPILQIHLPSINKAMCFNEHNKSFVEEVKATEVGHLFEHILLEYLCLLKIKAGMQEVSFEGETHWNWKRDPWGTFHIEIKTGSIKKELFSEALAKSIELLLKILKTKRTDKYN